MLPNPVPKITAAAAVCMGRCQGVASQQPLKIWITQTFASTRRDPAEVWLRGCACDQCLWGALLCSTPAGLLCQPAVLRCGPQLQKAYLEFQISKMTGSTETATMARTTSAKLSFTMGLPPTR